MRFYSGIALVVIALTSFSVAIQPKPKISRIEVPQKGPNEKIIFHTGYATSYNHQHHQPNWVAYELFSTRLNAVTERNNRFIQDPQIKPPTCLSADYTKSGYDRGHLAPAADMLWDEDAMRESFYMSNISPQVPGFNRGIWKVLEEKVREWARSGSHLFICTGPLLGDTLKKHIGVRNAVTVPDYFFKAIIDTVGVDRGIAFIIPNRSSKSTLATFAVSIDYLEEIISRDLFPALSDETETKLEKMIDKKFLSSVD